MMGSKVSFKIIQKHIKIITFYIYSKNNNYLFIFLIYFVKRYAGVKSGKIKIIIIVKTKIQIGFDPKQKLTNFKRNMLTFLFIEK